MEEPFKFITMKNQVKEHTATKRREITFKNEVIDRDQVFCEPGLLSVPAEAVKNCRAEAPVEDPLKNPVKEIAAAESEVPLMKEVAGENQEVYETGIFSLPIEIVQVKWKSNTSDEEKEITVENGPRTCFLESRARVDMEYGPKSGLESVEPCSLDVDMITSQDSNQAEGMLKVSARRGVIRRVCHAVGRSISKHSDSQLVGGDIDDEPGHKDRSTLSRIVARMVKETVGSSSLACGKKDKGFDLGGTSSSNIDLTDESRSAKWTVATKVKERGKRYAQIRHSKMLARVQAGDSPYKCKECGKQFIQVGDLKRHARVHTGERPYECKECGQRFTQLGHMKRHSSVHTGESPYVCKECGQRFTRLGGLQAHTRIHTGERPYECKACGQRFTQLKGLKAHNRIHTGEKPYKCKECGYQFAELRSLNRHTNDHTGERPYECDECEKRFTRLENLKRHLRVHIS